MSFGSQNTGTRASVPSGIELAYQLGAQVQVRRSELTLTEAPETLLSSLLELAKAAE